MTSEREKPEVIEYVRTAQINPLPNESHSMKSHERSIAEGILFTDQYQLTMAQLYYRMGLHQKKAQFDHFFRSYPDYGSHKAGYCINAGLGWLLDWMSEAHFRKEDIDYLRTQRGGKGTPVFQEDFLEWLAKEGNFDGISLQAVPEGRVIHPNIPVTVVEGPLAMAQILETALLNQLNYQILIATKAARIRESGRGQVLLEFGARRAQDVGANAGARAAMIGGADFTSNVGISHLLGYQPKGTHAHSMVQAFIALGEGELAAFRAFAELYPDDCLLLVDTINTLECGVPNAIKVFEELRRKGHEPVGIRLDSGDLAYLSIQAALMLNAAGFPNTKIVWSNQLDEMIIWQIITQIQQEAPRYGLIADELIKRFVYGVGTRLITSAGDPALDGVYKLVAVHDSQGDWLPAIKISESVEKTLNPGHKRVWRIYDRREKATADLVTLDEEDPTHQDIIELHHPTRHGVVRQLSNKDISGIEPLLVSVLEEGRQVYEVPTIEEMRQQRMHDMERLDPGVKRLVNPHTYHVSLSRRLWNLKQELILSVNQSEI
jgi:nicotinate phosphoribosyltransferase